MGKRIEEQIEIQILQMERETRVEGSEEGREQNKG